MQTTAIGTRAEKYVALHLRKRGYKLLALNWQTPVCEVDIVAFKADCVYFVEVRYRSSQEQGGGFSTVTRRKLHHMQRAAEIWVRHQQWLGEYTIVVAEVSGSGVIKLAEI